ncbi:outer membrane protein assembly factor BamA [Bradyrhizobium sp. LHD-71]|uniref:outer membrane protein assembly factor BamA n=1 Tax=Bradyrhizobium sp. LHD-71 TaxID=3072141 RepID=UPI00280F850A|nr:outer membrane protein assembly factor BamA [Bradyrhizobium sp. LHD-71]MDQ8728768.1 outer membrane protein assembly factor BamA [Bradyrhizobium sp. LHD-71]
MRLGLRTLRGGLAAVLITVALPAALVGATTVASPAIAQSASSIVVEGNRRVEADTIRSYFRPGSGGRIDSGSINDALRALYETGLFQDVRINQAGGRLVVTVIENPVISRVIFEGNRKMKDEQLASEVQSKPRGSLSRPLVQSDTQRITEIYRRQGRYDVSVVPQIIEQPNNRVDLIFEVNEGGKTGVKSIEFVGNKAVSDYRLRDVIKTRETNLLSFLGSGDVYDPDRVEADRDLIRRYYLKNGYADIQVVAALTEYDPQRRGFLVTFQIEEGRQYRVGSIDIQSNIRGLDPNAFRSFLRLGVGSVYNGEAIEKSVEEITVEAARRGYAFATVRPRGERNFENGTVSIVLVLEEGPRVYVERINVRGNTRTKDYVIRREFDIAEGDAYNRALIDRAERRLKNLDYFKTVKILTEPGSSADRVVIVVDLEEKSTGDFSVSGGYSTSDGFLAEVSVSERNLLGTGLYAKAGVQYGERTRGYNVSVVEPFLFGYRIAGGIDIFQRQQLPSSYVSYETTTIGGSARLGFALREDLSMQVRYSLYRQEVGIDPTLQNCNNNVNNASLGFNPTPSYVLNPTNGLPVGFDSAAYLAATSGLGCYADGEASLPIKIELANGAVWTSSVGYTLAYNTLDNNKDPTSGLLAEFRQDIAGLGGDVKYLRSAVDARFYFPVISDVVGVLRGQGGHIMGLGGGDLRMLDHFQMGPNLVRGFAPVGIGPRDITLGTAQDALGGTMYWGASVELQMPFWFLPKEAGLKGAIYADAGSLWDYKGPETFPSTLESITVAQNGMQVRASVGAGIIWQSPFGPLRFDYAIPVAKGPNDRTQEFRFGGGTSF